uniref:hypothetical protein n=1 Tax=Brucella pseudintermedia TaxID=370111 RepID=UPI001AEE391E
MWATETARHYAPRASGDVYLHQRNRVAGDHQTILRSEHPATESNIRKNHGEVRSSSFGDGELLP